MIRAFVAVEVPAAAVQPVVDAQAALRRWGGPVKWVDPALFHFTLKFLGDIQPDAVSRVEAAVKRAVAGQAPFAVTLAGLGVFPSMSRPRVIWVGATEGADQLGELARRVEAELVGAGYPAEEKPFRPHVTLGRLREGAAALPSGLAVALQVGRGQVYAQMPVKEVVLMESKLSIAGPTYTPLKRIPFAL